MPAQGHQLYFFLELHYPSGNGLGDTVLKWQLRCWGGVEERERPF